MKNKKEKRFGIVGGCVSVCIMLCVLYLVSVTVTKIAANADAETEKSLVESIHRATVQCYAIEGRYPPDVEYLKDYYGIQVDEEKYHVFYEGFASNIMPDITVIRLEQ